MICRNHSGFCSIIVLPRGKPLCQTGSVNSLALVLILGAAALHAGWNVLLKTSGDPLGVSARAMAAGALVMTPPAALVWLLAGRPDTGGWAPVGLAALSAVAELAYFVALSTAYRRGELSVVYPLARGTAPLLAVIAGLLVLRERVGPLEIVGIACLLAGIWSVRRPAARAATVPALLTGVAIATYSTIDAAGVQLASPWLYGWMIWVGTALLLTLWVRLPRSRAGPPAGGEPMSRARAVGLGLMMSVSYLLVLLALRLAPLVVVAPLRESAIVLVAIWGVWRLDERAGMALRLAGAGAILVGAALLTLGR